MTTTNTTFADRLNKRLDEKSLSQIDVARSLGVSQQAVSRWCKGTAQPRLEVIPNLAKFLGVPASFLAFREDEAAAQTETDDLIRLRRFEFSACCGTDLTAQESCGVETITVTKTWFAQNISHAFRDGDQSRYSIIDARGDSMSPTWENGDILIVDNLQRSVDRDGFYVFTFDGTSYAKRVQRIGRTLLVISDNDKYESFRLEKDDLNLVTVHGRIIRSMNIKDLA